jgi:hypothetical protein
MTEEMQTLSYFAFADMVASQFVFCLHISGESHQLNSNDIILIIESAPRSVAYLL